MAMLPIELLDIIIYSHGPKFAGTCRDVCREWRGLRDLPSAMLEVHAPYNALMRAAKHASVDTFRALKNLIDADVDGTVYGAADIDGAYDAADSSNPTAFLNGAATAGNVPMCRAMFETDLFWSTKDIFADNVLFPAACSESVECCNVFISHLKTPFFTISVVLQRMVIASSSNDAVCVLLLDHLRRHPQPDAEDGNTILSILDLAITYGRLGACKAILARMRSMAVAYRSSAGDLMVEAAAHGHADICKYFCEHEAKPCHGGSAALLSAATLGDTDLCLFLCDRERFGSAAAKARTNKVLMAAAKGGHAETCEALVRCGADPRAKKSQALVAAFKNGHVETCRMLMDLGANPHDVSLLNKGAYDLIAARQASR
ncbi:hypothetical protein FOA52_014285 [Chlamydomonas sp. UWO 241]|nr:hypothetical protein FOA52_014285 [Chlamydomonas sp. UWO 241]